MKIGYIGLGKMGCNMVTRLIEKKYDVVAYDVSVDARDEARKIGAQATDSIQELVNSLKTLRLIWIMVPHKVVDVVLGEIVPLLDRGDTIIDSGNSNYKDSMRRATEAKARGIAFLDAGVSGGPDGARRGACIMVGGERLVFDKFESLFRDLAVPDGYGYMGKNGAGHFVKMVHNGIEYGMMQAIAEGFSIMKKSDFGLDLTRVTDVYSHKSVIESRLVGWLKNAYEQSGEGLDGISGKVAHSGEGKWTVEAARELDIPAPIIEGALRFRKESQENPSYTGQIISALRNQFGGHDVSNAKKKGGGSDPTLLT